MSVTSAVPAPTDHRAATRSVGLWLAVAAGLYSLVNVARAVIDPGAFAVALGLPLADAADSGWVGVYAARTAFIAVLVLVLAAQRDLRALSIVAAVSVLMPVADAVLTARAEAGPATVARHVAIAAYLSVTAVLLRRAVVRRGGRS